MSENDQHMGTKFIGLFFGIVLSMIYTIKEFFSPMFAPISSVANILFVWAIFVFVIPLIIFLAEIIWRYVHKYSEKFPV